MNKEYNIVYCKPCNAIKITEEDATCLICNGPSEVIGFEHQVIQDILAVENEG